MREIVFADADGARLVGTFHRPQRTRFDVGLLLLNAGYVPRDGHGGLSALCCDRVAGLGMPAFRFDLPMLGDSPGEVPARTQDLFDHIYAGGFGPATVEIARQLRRRFDLDGVVVGGLCGAAITATHAADLDPHGVHGLVVLEPELSLPEPVPSDQPRAPVDGSATTRIASLVARASSYWGWMRLLTRESQHGRWVPLPREALLRLVLHSGHLPGVTNVPLVDAWRRVMARGVPALAITARGKMHDVLFQQVNRLVLRRGGGASLTHVRLPSTNHVFTSGGAIDAVGTHMVSWLRDTFPARASPVDATNRAVAAG